MDSIVLRVSDLALLASVLKTHKMEYVRLDLQDADPPNVPDPLPACAFVSAMRPSNPDVIYEFAELEQAESGTCTFDPSFPHTNMVD